MNGLAERARQLARQRSGHLVLSVYLDFDPERFATPPARASQVNSLIDEAAKGLEGQDGLGREDRIGLREDLERVKRYLLSREPPFSGAGALAVFCSGRAGLFETVALPQPVPGRVVLDPAPYVEPMLDAAMQREWCVVLVSRREARVFTGTADTLVEVQEEQDHVHQAGGSSQTRYERSVEKDVDEHLKHVAEIVELRLRRERFDRLAIGGPAEIVPRLEALLGEEARARLAPDRIEADVATTGQSEIRTAMAGIAETDVRAGERAALDRLAAGIGSGGRGVGGPTDTVAALNERRVEILLMEPGFDAHAQRCPACGMIVLGEETSCPADGTKLEPVEHLREAVAQAAFAQDAEVTVLRHHSDLGRHGGIGAVLRF